MTLREKHAMKSNRDKHIICITSIGHALCHIYMLILAGALVPIAAAFNTSLTVITTLGTACYLIFGLFCIPAGLLTTKTNAKFTLKLFFILSAACCILIGLADNLWTFGIGLCLLGLIGSLYHVSGLTLISQNIARKGRAMGIHGVSGSLGIAIAPLLTGLILTVQGWRQVYFIMAVPGIAGFLLLHFNHSIQATHTIKPSPQQDLSGREQKQLIPFFLMMLFAMAVNGLVYRGFLTALPTYLSQTITMGRMSGIVTGGLLSTLILSVGMAGQYAGGHLSDKFSMIKLYLFFLILTIPFMLIMGYVQNIWLIVAAVLFALFHFPQQPVENHLISKLMPPHIVGSGYGIKFTFTFGFGSFASGLVGVIADNFDLAMTFPVLAGLILISSLIVLMLSSKKVFSS